MERLICHKEKVTRLFVCLICLCCVLHHFHLFSSIQVIHQVLLDHLSWYQRVSPQSWELRRESHHYHLCSLWYDLTGDRTRLPHPRRTLYHFTIDAVWLFRMNTMLLVSYADCVLCYQPSDIQYFGRIPCSSVGSDEADKPEVVGSNTCSENILSD